MTDTVVAEGQVKFRDGKKWKTRWVVLRKPSPVADCLFLLAYKKEKKKGKKGTGQKERLSITLEGICGVEPASGFDGVSYSLSILCISHTLVLGFQNREAMQAWDSRIRYHLGEVHRFSVNVEPGTKLESGPASLHLCNNQLVLTKGLPPVVSGHWKLSALRRYGAVPNGFVFEGGTRCGYWAGVFFLSCSEGEQITFLFDCIVRGIAPSRTPQGLSPAPPADPNPASTEERIIQETSELEKRLSRLSNCSLASSTASTFSCSTSVAGDDHSSISSSSSSQSEASYGGRLSFWVDSLSKLHPSNDTVSTCSTLKALTSSDDRLYAAVTGSTRTRPSSAQLHPRGLHDSGRQSSLDSGIGIATGSQSSGSFSSYTESLDAAIHTGGEEFGSVASLSSPQTSAPPITPPPPPPTVAPPTPIQDRAPSVCTSSCSSRCSSRASRRRSDEYSVPSLLRLRYDTPRSLLQTLILRDPSSPGAPSDPGRDSLKSGGQGQCRNSGPPEGKGLLQAMMQRSNSWDSEGGSTARPQSLPGSLVFGQTQCSHASDNYITPEQWRSVGNKSWAQVEKSASERSNPAFTPDEHEDKAFGNLLARLKISMPSIPPASLALPVQPKPACGISIFRSDSEVAHPAFPDTGRHSHNTVHYVNIPISPLLAKGNRELLYSELDLREPSPAPVSSRHVPQKVPQTEEVSCSGYAHLNIGAMETAQRVGAEHVRGREDRLTQLENRLQGPPN